MTLFIIGLVLFLGVHSTRILADGWRKRQIDRIGQQRWKLPLSILSLAGLVLLVIGYGKAHDPAQVLWVGPAWTGHVAALLTLAGLILFGAAKVPDNKIKAAVKHPMVLGTGPPRPK